MLGGLRGVKAVRGAGGTWTLEVAAAHEALPALLAYLDTSSFGLTELRTHSPTLDDVFVSLTGRTLRDGA
jgi:ABC-2 type transport system ATP-binding protein